MSLWPHHYVNLMSIRPYVPHRPLSLHNGAPLGHYLYIRGKANWIASLCKLPVSLLRACVVWPLGWNGHTVILNYMGRRVFLFFLSIDYCLVHLSLICLFCYVLFCTVELFHVLCIFYSALSCPKITIEHLCFVHIIFIVIRINPYY